MALFALIGYPLNNSSSADFFNLKFREAELPHAYINQALPDLKELNKWIASQPNLRGFNVTRPYKEQIIPFLHELSEEARSCGAVNCVSINSKGFRTGFNTDVFGFKTSLMELIAGASIRKALVIGNGGASKSVWAALNQLGIEYITAARNPRAGHEIQIDHLTHGHFIECNLVINTTPVGMFPNVEELLPLPYEAIRKEHYCFDLIYLPEKTPFLLQAEKRGAKIMNGHKMLILQAEKAWEIWQAAE